jgi:GTP-binding protein
MKPVVAIVGRANVGKSALFNRLVGKQISIVEDLPGTTRDRIFADAFLQDQEITLIDTGGLDPSPSSTMSQKIKHQVKLAIAEADVIIFLGDIKDGVIASDIEIADLLRKSGKPVVLAANKADNANLENQVNDFYQLGLGTPLAISALHGRGITDIADSIITLVPQRQPDIADNNIASKIKMPKLAIVGRPSTGKSTLLNTIIGEERAIVSDVPGTTRDAIDTVFHHDGQDLLLIDTAGIRRRGRSSAGIEYYSLIRSLRAISRCDIALLVIDATEFITAQDIHIAGYIKDACKGMILIINKWDLVSRQPQEEYAAQVRQRLKFAAYVPILFVSAKLAQGIDRIIPTAMEIWQERQKQLPDSVIDKLIKQAISSHAPPRKGLRRLEVIRAYQNGINPPSFFLLVNDPKLVHFSYHRYLENKLRQTFGFSGTSLRFLFKKAPRRKPERAGGRKR